MYGIVCVDLFVMFDVDAKDRRFFVLFCVFFVVVVIKNYRKGMTENNRPYSKRKRNKSSNGVRS